MGDLQRMLRSVRTHGCPQSYRNSPEGSSYFNVPITVKRVYVSQTADPRPTPTVAEPIIQHRRVHLLTAPFVLRSDTTASPSLGAEDRLPQQRVVCVATSIVRISSEPAAQKFLDEKYAIGQVFRILGRVVCSFSLWFH
jgi:hypothetical protein